MEVDIRKIINKEKQVLRKYLNKAISEMEKDNHLLIQTKKLPEAKENEIKAMTDLLHKVNFNGVLSYHSRGEIIFWYKPFESREYNNLQKLIGNMLGRKTQYKLVPWYKDKKRNGSDGTLSDHIADNYHKPVFTLETIPAGTKFPIDRSLIDKAYHQVKYTGLAIANEALYLENINYYPYKVYQDNNFLHDFRTLDQAKKHAKKFERSTILKEDKVLFHSNEDRTKKEILNLVKFGKYEINK